MKKKILFVTAIFAGSLAFAQGTTTSIKNKKGLEYLPQAGDWAIQFDAAPALNYLGNAFSNAGTTSPGAASPFGVNSTFVGKKFNSASDAWRVKVGINVSRMSEDSTFYNGNRSEYVKTSKSSITNVVLGFGKEWRRGHNRLQGFYGVEGLLQIGSSRAVPSYEYSLNLKAAVDSGFEAANTPRTKGITKFSSFGIGARGFIGVEYFVLPKISIGGEFGWGFGYMTTSSEGESEVYNGTDVIPVKSVRPKNSGLVIDNDNGGTIFGGSASINVSFHF